MSTVEKKSEAQENIIIALFFFGFLALVGIIVISILAVKIGNLEDRNNSLVTCLDTAFITTGQDAQITFLSCMVREASYR